MEEKLNCESKRIQRLTLPNWCNQYNISICSFLMFDKHLLILVNGGKNVTFHFFLGVIKCVYSFRLLVYFQLVYWGSWWFKRETNRSSLHPPPKGSWSDWKPVDLTSNPLNFADSLNPCALLWICNYWIWHQFVLLVDLANLILFSPFCLCKLRLLHCLFIKILIFLLNFANDWRAKKVAKSSFTFMW